MQPGIYCGDACFIRMLKTICPANDAAGEAYEISEV
jgi:hypothetical protein